MQLPRTVDELIDLIDLAYPLRSFPVDMAHHVIQRELGKRDVVDFLRQLQKERDEDIAGHFNAAVFGNE